MKALLSSFVARYGWPTQAALRPLCIGHRGACAHANENTLRGFAVAARLGADMWELDARLSRDGVVIVSHDDAVTSADGRRIRLSAHDAFVITRIPLERGGTVPTLRSVIELAIETGCGLYVEVKERAAALPTLLLLSGSAVSFAAVGSFDHDTVRDLAGARREHPRLPVSVLVRIGEDPFAAAAQTGAEVIHLCWERASHAPDRLVTPDLLARASREGLVIVIWHEERRDVLDRLMTLPVAGICTDKPEMMNRYVPHPEYPIDVVCHRGMNAIAPENTLHAAWLCYDQGFQVVELDVRSSVEGALAVIHDAALDRTTDGSGPVAARPMSELSKLSAGVRFDPFFAGERIAPLAAFIEAAGACSGLYIEIKDADPTRILAEVVRAGILPRVFFWSSDATRLATLRCLRPDARIMAERESFASIQDAMAVPRSAIVQFDATCDDLSEISLCRQNDVTTMIKYFGNDFNIFYQIIRRKPNMVNIERPDVFLKAYAKVSARE